MKTPITQQLIEQANKALSEADPEKLIELFELGKRSIEEPAGKWMDGKEIAPGISTMPHYFLNDVAGRIMTILYELNLIVSFDWMEWQEGKELLSNDNLEKLTGKPAHMLVGLLTALARNDRFCDGAWGSAVEKGSIAKLLSELEKRTNGE